MQLMIPAISDLPCQNSSRGGSDCISTVMRILTLTTIDDQTVTVISDNLCSIEQNRDLEGSIVTLSNGLSYTVRETMLEIVTALQAVDDI